MRVGIRGAGALFLGVLLSACAGRASVGTGPGRVRCTPPLEPNLRVDLYVGGGIPDSTWKRFTEDVLVKHFPAGGTALGNTGWWLGPRDITAHGAGRVLILLAPARDSSSHREHTRAVIAEIKARFRQLSVGWEEDWVCVSW